MILMAIRRFARSCYHGFRSRKSFETSRHDRHATDDISGLTALQFRGISTAVGLPESQLMAYGMKLSIRTLLFSSKTDEKGLPPLEGSDDNNNQDALRASHAVFNRLYR